MAPNEPEKEEEAGPVVILGSSGLTASEMEAVTAAASQMGIGLFCIVDAAVRLKDSFSDLSGRLRPRLAEIADQAAILEKSPRERSHPNEPFYRGLNKSRRRW